MVRAKIAIAALTLLVTAAGAAPVVTADPVAGGAVFCPVQPKPVGEQGLRSDRAAESGDSDWVWNAHVAHEEASMLAERLADRAYSWRRGQEKCWSGEGLGGPYVPGDFIDMSKPDKPGFASRNQQIFEELRDQFSSTVEYDSSGAEPIVRCVTGPRWN